MPFRQLPASKAATLAALTAAEQKGAGTDQSLWLVSPQQFSECLELAPPPAGQPGSILFRLRKELGEEADALAAQTPLTTALDTTRGLLRLTLSHFVQNLNNAILRGVLPREARTTYQLPLDSDLVPDLITDADLLLWSDRLVNGDADRVAAGGTALAWPSAAEITTLKAQLVQRSAAQSTAKDATDTESHDVEVLMPLAIAAVKDLWDTIEFNLRHELTNASRRRRAREWGVYYALRPGETPDPEEGGTPPPPPPPPNP